MALAKSSQGSEKLYYDIPGFTGQSVFHGFFGRFGGVSKNVYASLNCGPGSDDHPEHVDHNRRVVAGVAGCAPEQLLTLYQVHGNACVRVTEGWRDAQRPQADAMVTDQPGFALGILTADCAPVLFYGEKSDGSPVIGAAHAGWGGALKGVLEETLSQMKALGATSESLKACIGPCIGQSSYEVQDDFADALYQEDDENERFFKPGKRSGHLMFDLAGYCAFKLYKQGMKDVFIKDLDTYFNEEEFFSYRRATHRSEKDYGRQISVITIKP